VSADAGVLRDKTAVFEEEIKEKPSIIKIAKVLPTSVQSYSNTKLQ